MAIIDLLTLRARKQVACFGGAPSGDDERAFKDHDFSVASCTDAELQESAYLSGVTAVIFTQNAEKPLQIVRHLEKHAERLLDYDCRIIVRLAPNGRSIVINGIDYLCLPTAGLKPEEEGKFSVWQPERLGYQPLPHVRIFDVAADWKDVAKVIVANPAGHAPDGNLQIIIEAKNNDKQPQKLSLGEELLFKRAFWDCAEVHLVPMTDGLSGESVYRAYAELAASHAGRWPLTYFVKVGDRNNIYAEYRNYEQGVRSNIPFHLGPRLVRERCCLGAKKGIIVGDYVEESESLRDCASDGRAATAIAGLFNRTLSGWYRHASEDQRSLAMLLLPLFPEKIPRRRCARAKKLGATKTLVQLRVLFECCDSTPVLVGPIHGDLHASNVLVRGADAIVIDFYKHGIKPLLYDAACLEAGLLVDGFVKDMRDISTWFKSVKPLYSHIPLHMAPTCCHPKDPSSWYYTCVHQIRLYARQMECCEGQYAAALAVALLKKACKDMKFDEAKESRRAAAYVLAELVLLMTFGHKLATAAHAVKS